MKLDRSVWNSEIVIEAYDLIRLDRCGKEDGVTCFTKHSFAYSYKTNMCLNTKYLYRDISTKIKTIYSKTSR